jgi:quercetin dioxygenase-like cupin family protein
MLIVAPAGVPHGVVNDGDDLLTFLTVIAPFG